MERPHVPRSAPQTIPRSVPRSSTERTAPPRSAHVQLDDDLGLLDPARETRGRRVLRQRDGAPEVGDDLVSAGLRPSSAETRSRGKTMEVCGRAAVRKSSQICPKSPIYIGGGRGALPWGPRDPQGVGRARGEDSPPPPNRVLLGLVGGSPSAFLLLPFFFFPLIFSLSWRIGDWWAVPPAH